MWSELSQRLRRYVMPHISPVSPDYLSRTIDLSRISLIVGLVFLHYGTYPNFQESPFGGMSVTEYEVATFINSFLLFFFFSVVPLLSLVSGWLFFSFLNDPQSDAEASLSKRIRRRYSSLYVPLIVWNSLYVAILIVLFVIVPEHPLFRALNVDFKGAGSWEFFNAIFGFDHHPLAFQFWFVRDLFLTVLLSPVLWLMLRRAPYSGAIALFAVWIANYNLEIFFRPDVPFFFYMGGLIRSKRFNLGLSGRATLTLIAVYVVAVALRTMAPYVVDHATPGLGALTRSMRLIGVLACWGAFLRIARTAFGAHLAQWGSLAFFLHAAHFPLMAAIKLLLWNLLPQVNDFWMVTHYLVSVITTITLALGVGVLFSKYRPKLFAVLNGGREIGAERNFAKQAGAASELPKQGETMQRSSESEYVPALRFRWLTPFYDAVVGSTTRERSFKRALIKQAGFEPGQRVLDLACGTGTLAIWIKQFQPQAEICGVDGDPAILSLAVRKAQKAKATVQFDHGLSYSLPYPANRFDRVVSSLFFHHLSWEDKQRTAQELFRVLKPGAELHVADWGRPTNALMRGSFLLIQLLDGFKNTQDNVLGKLVASFEKAGFIAVSQRQTFGTLFGTMALYSAVKPCASIARSTP